MHERGRIICDCCDASYAELVLWHIPTARREAVGRGWAYRRSQGGLMVDLCPNHARLSPIEWHALLRPRVTHLSVGWHVDLARAGQKKE